MSGNNKRYEMNKLLVIAIAVIITTARPAKSAIVVFDFASTSGTNQTGMDLDELAAGSSEVAGVTLSATANTGVFNLTASPNFGINASGSGDVTDAFDFGSGIHEVMTFSFTPSTPSTMTFVSIDFDRITSGNPGNDQGNLSFFGGSSTDFDATNIDASDLLTVGESITAGQLITLSHIDGNGFGLEQITLDVNPTAPAIPEPMSGSIWIGLVLGGLALFCWGKKPDRISE